MKLPSEFEARTLEWMGEETYRALEAALQTEPPVSIRVNRTKWSGPCPVCGSTHHPKRNRERKRRKRDYQNYWCVSSVG